MRSINTAMCVYILSDQRNCPGQVTTRLMPKTWSTLTQSTHNLLLVPEVNFPFIFSIDVSSNRVSSLEPSQSFVIVVVSIKHLFRSKTIFGKWNKKQRYNTVYFCILNDWGTTHPMNHDKYFRNGHTPID